MSRSLSTRAIAAVAVLFAIVIAGVLLAVAVRPALAARRLPRTPLPLPIAEAVDRTLREPAARLRLDFTKGGGPVVSVRGVVRLQGADADLTVTVPSRDDKPPVRIKIVGLDAWIRPDGEDEWVQLSAESLDTTEAVTWRLLLGGLRPAPSGGAQAVVGGQPADVSLDDRGRIRRLRVALDRQTFDLRLDGYDDDLPVPAPP